MLSAFREKKAFSAIFSKRADAAPTGQTERLSTVESPRPSTRDTLSTPDHLIFRCQRCAKTFAERKTTTSTTYTCLYCAYPVCRYCREPAQRKVGAAGWLCCVCNLPPTLMRLFAKTKDGAALVQLVGDYCDSRTQRVLFSIFHVASGGAAGTANTTPYAAPVIGRDVPAKEVVHAVLGARREDAQERLSAAQRIRAELAARRRLSEGGGGGGSTAVVATGDKRKESPPPPNEASPCADRFPHPTEDAVKSGAALAATNTATAASVEGGGLRPVTANTANQLQLHRSKTTYRGGSRSATPPSSPSRSDEEGAAGGAHHRHEDSPGAADGAVHHGQKASYDPQRSPLLNAPTCGRAGRAVQRDDPVYTDSLTPVKSEFGVKDNDGVVEYGTPVSKQSKSSAAGKESGAGFGSLSPGSGLPGVYSRSRYSLDEFHVSESSTAQSASTSTQRVAGGGGTPPAGFSRQPQQATRLTVGQRSSGAAFEREEPLTGRTDLSAGTATTTTAATPVAPQGRTTIRLDHVLAGEDSSSSGAPSARSTPASSPSGRSESPAPRFPTFTQFLDDQAYAAQLAQQPRAAAVAGSGAYGTAPTVTVSPESEDEVVELGVIRFSTHTRTTKGSVTPRQKPVPSVDLSSSGKKRPGQRRSQSALTPRGLRLLFSARGAPRRTSGGRTTTHSAFACEANTPHAAAGAVTAAVTAQSPYHHVTSVRLPEQQLAQGALPSANLSKKTRTGAAGGPAHAPLATRMSAGHVLRAPPGQQRVGNRATTRPQRTSSCSSNGFGAARRPPSTTRKNSWGGGGSTSSFVSGFQRNASQNTRLTRTGSTAAGTLHRTLSANRALTRTPSAANRLMVGRAATAERARPPSAATGAGVNRLARTASTAGRLGRTPSTATHLRSRSGNAAAGRTATYSAATTAAPTHTGTMRRMERLPSSSMVGTGLTRTASQNARLLRTPSTSNGTRLTRTASSTASAVPGAKPAMTRSRSNNVTPSFTRTATGAGSRPPGATSSLATGATPVRRPSPLLSRTGTGTGLAATSRMTRTASTSSTTGLAAKRTASPLTTFHRNGSTTGTTNGGPAARRKEPTAASSTTTTASSRPLERTASRNGRPAASTTAPAMVEAAPVLVHMTRTRRPGTAAGTSSGAAMARTNSSTTRPGKSSAATATTRPRGVGAAMSTPGKQRPVLSSNQTTPMRRVTRGSVGELSAAGTPLLPPPLIRPRSPRLTRATTSNITTTSVTDSCTPSGSGLLEKTPRVMNDEEVEVPLQEPAAYTLSGSGELIGSATIAPADAVIVVTAEEDAEEKEKGERVAVVAEEEHEEQPIASAVPVAVPQRTRVGGGSGFQRQSSTMTPLSRQFSRSDGMRH